MELSQARTPFILQLFKSVAERGQWNLLLEDAHAMYSEGALDKALVRYVYLAETGFELAQSNAAYTLDHAARHYPGALRCQRGECVPWTVRNARMSGCVMIVVAATQLQWSNLRFFRIAAVSWCCTLCLAFSNHAGMAACMSIQRMACSWTRTRCIPWRTSTGSAPHSKVRTC